MADVDKFSEEELPRGAVLLIGRTASGMELACSVPIESDHAIKEILARLREALAIYDTPEPFIPSDKAP